MVIVEGGALLEHQALRRMFEARKQVFVDLLKWDLPVLNGRYEIDQFDDEHAAYIVIGSDDGMHLGSARLLKTTRAHILGDLFPELCAGPVPTGADVLEITRFCLGRGQGAMRRRETRNQLISALVRHALAKGIRVYTGVAEMGWLQQILAFGWDCRPLGKPVEFGCGLLGALSISITPETPFLLEQSGIWVSEEIFEPVFAEAA
jgi:N-acyl-L-homoserine lactone synthetase